MSLDLSRFFALVSRTVSWYWREDVRHGTSEELVQSARFVVHPVFGFGR